MPTTAKRLLSSARAHRGGEAIAPTDGELLMRFRRSGDREALAQILDRHASMVWGVCRNVLHREQDAQDAFQATFLILLRRADSIRANDSAAGWLYRVALRAACDVRRTRLRRREEPLDAEPPQPEPAFPDIERRQLAAALMEELRALPDKYQVPLVLRYLEGLSRSQIADQLDTTVAGVQGCLVRGKRQLRSRLVRRGVSLSVAMGVVAGGRPTEAAPVAPVINSGGAAAAFSPVVQQLTASGVHTMLIAAYAKPAIVAVVLTMAAVLATTSASPRAASTLASGPPLTLDSTPAQSEEAGAIAISIAADRGVPNSQPEVANPLNQAMLVEGLMKDPHGPRLTREEADWLVATGFGDPADPRRRLIDKLEAASPGQDFLSLFASKKHRAEGTLDKRFDLVAAELSERSTDADKQKATDNAIELPVEVEVEHVQLDLVDAKPDPARAEPQQELVDAYRRLVQMIRMRHEQGTINATPLAAAESRYASALAELHLLRGERDEAVRQLQAAVDGALKRTRFLHLQMAMEEGTPASVDEMFDAAEQLARAKQALVAAQQEAGVQLRRAEGGGEESAARRNERSRAPVMQAEAMQAQARALELQREMAMLQKHAEQLQRSAANGGAPTPPPSPSLNITAPFPPTAPVPPDAALPPGPPTPPVAAMSPSAESSRDTVEPGDRIVISRSHTVFEERMSPEGERQRVPREVHEQQVAVTDAEGNLNLPGIDKAIPLTGRTVAEATQLLQEHDPRFESVKKFSDSDSASGLASPLVSASPGVNDQLDAMRRRLEVQGRVIEELQQRLQTSGGSQYGPESTMKQGSWNAEHEPSAIDPMGWAVIADLSVGAHMPVLFPGDPRPRPHLRLVRAAKKDGLAGEATGLMAVVDPGRESDALAATLRGSGGPASQVEVRGQLFELRELGPGRAPGSTLILLRCVQGRTDEELDAAVPSVEEAMQVLYKPRDNRQQLSQLREQATQLTEQRDQLREQVEAAKQQVQQAREEAAKQRAIAMQQAQQAMQEVARVREQLDQQRKELQRQAEMLKEQRKNEQGRGAGAENPAPAAGDESDNS
ncbi:ECF RNA polymerase sigma factor SigW [Posidoniimonas corsicana]|uniref:ECF RNA polymerase sigma factor SigW n=1 Tax=Posidoniimonas corsicana TaxID=1938618 RepID=A0A5C5VIN4_9BACT|nr:sigma-70 family RNA polymerase sigma factor [Posidoniimonas corsicana]TWT37961.1 ECF RNA polymerase sigma factor SigW [Posidoniimonas corsicana]